MGDEREFKIKISGDAAELTAASEAGAQALEKTGEATKKVAAAQEEGGHAAHKGAEEHRAMHQAMHAISEESPIMGLALRAGMSPIAAVLGAALIEFHKLKQGIEELEKSLTTSQWESYGGVVKAG